MALYQRPRLGRLTGRTAEAAGAVVVSLSTGRRYRLPAVRFGRAANDNRLPLSTTMLRAAIAVGALGLLAYVML